ncbi:hypothetical protein [Absicoccus intestinalis]|uniref:Bacteriocin transport accessory protein n=1 Tax=Absicoccus intestinalis TaxID=2926319 RepID=A0ABU4WM24_9FIRM|nr:hypothetical protein [Absicoccus sp. CLA-KB-P134]MDX8417278.1 hypothetical protein [Absicoccus sp. CLA-KB-P134]
MKRLFSIVCVFAVFLSLVGCQSKKAFQTKDITVSQLQEKIKNKDTFVFMVERDGCQFCKKLNAYIKKTKGEHPNLTIYVVDSTDFGFQKETEDADHLISSTKDGKALLQIVTYFMYTPALYAIKKGKVKQAAIGFNDTDKTVGLWNNTSQIDFEQAEYEDFWDFVESSAQ